MNQVAGVIWSKRALKNFESIYNYYRPLSKQGADKLKQDILKTVSSLLFLKQYQIDEINPGYRRMVVRHYKVVYRVKGKEIRIINIFDCRQDTSKGKV